jgi:hypothetical protein
VLRLLLRCFASRGFRGAAGVVAAVMLLAGGCLSGQTAAWQAVGPGSVASIAYGAVSGRVTAMAADPNDASGNTVYVGTTGGGVWKSTNAAGAVGSVAFVPLTDTLPVFSGSANVPSLSIGALAVQPSANPVVLAGTGDPNDAADSYYGEGLLRSADGGATWTLISGSHDGANGNHSFAGLSVAGLAFSTATPALMVAAFSTSLQGAIVQATNSESIPGIYYSTDAGVTWQMATLYDGSNVVQEPQPLGTGQVGNAVTSVVWDALRREFFAAVRAHGYYSSPDGMTWTRLVVQPGANLTVVNCPVGVGGVGRASCPIFRGTLAVRPDTGDLYALTVDANDLDQGLWQDICAAASGTCATAAPTFAARVDNGALEVGSGSSAIAQGDYNLAMAAVGAAGGTNLYVGTVDLYRCVIAAGASVCSLRNTTNALNGCGAPAKVAPAEHTLAVVGESSGGPVVFLGNDGGLWRSLDGVAETGPVCDATDSSHFNNLNGAIGSLAEVVGFAQDPVAVNTLLVGLGANGSAATTAALPLGAWAQMSAGEGGWPAIDASAPTNWMLGIGAGVNLKQCALGGSCAAGSFVPPATVGAAQVNYDASLLDAPMLLDPALTSDVLVGSCRVWRGMASGVGWSSANAISAALDGSNATTCSTSNALIRSLGVGGANGTGASGTAAELAGSEVVYAGMAGTVDGGLGIAGAVFVTRTANAAFTAASWVNVATSLATNDTANAGVFNPEGFDVSSLAVDPHDATGATVYATILGFGGVPHVYRSADFGAHWLNVSANLPGVPANFVVVDPNDANTVYVAMDSGVYFTRQVATCAASNCWSLMGTGLPNSPVISLAAGAGLLTGDGRKGMLRAGTYGRGIWQTPLLTAVSLAQPGITLSASSLSFVAQQVATQSVAQTITITSSGTAPVTFGSPVVSGDFAETDTCAGQTLAVNATCTVSVVFAPTATGARSGLLTVYANVSGGQATVALTGAGTAAADITLNPLALGFGATVVNQSAAAQIITLNNTGGTAAALQMPVITGDFAISANTCGATLGASTGCALSIVFTPTASGNRVGTVSITDTSTGVTGTQMAQLTGVGESPASDTLAPGSLSFAQQQLNTASATQQMTITNAGDVPLTLISVAISPGDFTVVNGCGASLAGHAACVLTVAFIPTATGTRAATLTFTDVVRSQTVALTGVGVAPPGVSVSPVSVGFGETGVGLASAVQVVTLTNNGGMPLVVSGVGVSNNFTVASNTCGVTLAVSAACALQVVFAPTTAGPLTGALTITDNAASGMQRVSLTGVGVDFSLSANGSTSVTVGSGGMVSYPLLLSSLASVNGNVALSCSGTPTNSHCTVSPAAPVLGSTVTLTATVQTGVQAKLELPWRLGGEVFLAMLMPLAIGWRRRWRKGAVVLAIGVLVLLSGCGSGREIPTSGVGSASYTTPSGTYNLLVSATSAGITRSVPLTLIVQ